MSELNAEDNGEMRDTMHMRSGMNSDTHNGTNSDMHSNTHNDTHSDMRSGSRSGTHSDVHSDTRSGLHGKLHEDAAQSTAAGRSAVDRNVVDRNAVGNPSHEVFVQHAIVSGPHAGEILSSRLSDDEWKLLPQYTKHNVYRPHLPWWLYTLVFLFTVILCIGFMQAGVYTVEPLRGFGGLILRMFASHEYQFILNAMLVSAIYGIVIMITNRFWFSSACMLVVAGFIGIVEHLKVIIRYETIMPSDLQFLKHDAGNMFEFTPVGIDRTVAIAAIVLLTLAVVTYSISRRDGLRAVIRTRIRAIGYMIRVAVAALLASLLTWFTLGFSTADTPAYNFAMSFGGTPKLWDSVYDAKANGTLLSFLRFVNPKVMQEPAGYSKATMDRIVRKYAQKAKEINATRAYNLDDSTVIMVLSESFSDPTRVPGLALNQDPMPFIRQLKQQTTSGYMLSAGYGGGTANMEFMAYTGLTMANFDTSLTSPYQQLVPKLSWIPTVNRLWANGNNSQAFHPYEASMYSREGNYKKFGFTHFWTLNPPDIIAHQDHIDQSPYVKDSDAYQSLLEKIDINKSQFLSVLTMQNHMSYDNWYANNQFAATSTTGVPLGLDETTQINTYTKGVNYTDQATQAFLDQLNNINKPITVVFYGDHLPGVYASASSDSNNSIALHETDYFIWSNRASTSAGTKLPDSTAQYTSPNFFMAETAEHMNAKVSPYLAFLTELHAHVAAIDPPVVDSIQSWSRIPEGQNIYLDAQGNRIDIRNADKATQELLADYALIQYDITAGNQYLKDTAFTILPKVADDQEQQLPAGTKNAGVVPGASQQSAASDNATDQEAKSAEAGSSTEENAATNTTSAQ